MYEMTDLRSVEPYRIIFAAMFASLGCGSPASAPPEHESESRLDGAQRGADDLGDDVAGGLPAEDDIEAGPLDREALGGDGNVSEPPPGEGRALDPLEALFARHFRPVTRASAFHEPAA